VQNASHARPKVGLQHKGQQVPSAKTRNYRGKAKFRLPAQNGDATSKNQQPQMSQNQAEQSAGDSLPEKA